ncbi:MAG: hypothetical protein KA354_09515 [Phycisphaerae bacterium]|nr:hypothetical protein [Phycisphaerae bacterium]
MQISRLRQSVVGAVVGVLVWQSALAMGATVAYWRFEEGPADAMVLHTTGDGVFDPGVADSSGNGNALSAWTAAAWAGSAYRTDVAASTIPQTGATNSYSNQNTGDYPGLFTGSEAMRTMTPAAFTIEGSFKLTGTDTYRTIVGRDSRGATSNDGNLAALYFQLVPGYGVAIKYADVSGVWHEAISAGGAITAGRWYHMAAVSDGSTLTLYLNDAAAGAGYSVVAQTDMTASGSPNTALTAGIGSGGDWTAGTWSVARGLYAGGHTDRFYGYIDEVRISDEALTPSQFLFTLPPGSYMVMNPDTIDAAPYDPQIGVSLVIPTSCNESEPVDVTVTSDNPSVAKPAGSTGSTVVSYAVGDGPTKPVAIEFGGVAGQANFTLSGGLCPAGPGAALTVTVHAIESAEIQVTYDTMAVGGTQQARVIGSFGTVGTRDITSAAKGTTYAVDPAGVLTVGADGLITAVGVGSATVTAMNDGVTSSPVSITVGAAPSIAVAGPGILLVDLKATDPTAGTAVWNNTGLLGDFAIVGNPKTEVVAGVPAVTFSVMGDAYQGPLAPDALRTGSGWSVEVWMYNPTVDFDMESMVTWGHRNGPNGTNVSFGCGNDVNWGAVAAWGDPDIGWGSEPTGAPPTNQWLHLVYTYSYDAASNSSTIAVYDNGVRMNSEVTNYQLIPHLGTINLCAQNLVDPPSDFFMDEWGMLSLANVRVHGGTLTLEQVVHNYNAGIQTYVPDHMTILPQTMNAAVVDTGLTAAVTIPATCNASQAVAVTVTSSDPAVAKPAGGNGSAVLTFSAGGETTQTFEIALVSAGEADFTLSADTACPTGLLSTMHVTVYAAGSVDLKATYDIMQVGQSQQATVTADFGPVGTRDVSAASYGTTYAVSPAGVVDVSADGQITAVGLGTAILTASYGGLTTAQFTVVVAEPGKARCKVAGSGILLVDLSATDATAGQAVWLNKGSLGDFAAIDQPVLETIADEQAVTFNGTSAYQGPLAPAVLLGLQSRSIEVWAYNPLIECSTCIETMVAWGHRGGNPCGSNLAFGYGDHGTWGAVAGWCDNGDIGWNDAGGSPTLGEWHHLVYTYDPALEGGTTVLYDNGVRVNSEVSGAMLTHPGHINLAVQNLSANPMDLFTTAEMGILSLAVVRVHDGALTADEVDFNYRLGIRGLGQIRPDLNLDGYVNGLDFALFFPCAGGPAVPVTEACSIADFDGDKDVDQVDLGIYQWCFSGETPATPGCDTLPGT